ncbi:MAG TPA: prolyl oligopeptidase family serine peptidase [Candidatus Aminicenantes bacterium]|nr:prolyl oligopeptidase family serine peptidase [Candidatus Aminicenantes bacterium]HRY65809.1 prolyl oligopeptidase family serine peptidase [Candidatus Aminicenantes bacterium]HRZ72723.1 prolyl oligopeptidase family serine peptidase [Candidatus Aminicenantes bacterium]
MTKLRSLAIAALLPAILGAGLPGAAQDKPAAPRPIALQDILAWKSIGAAELSPDGAWFMYRLSPLEGESEVVIRQVAGTREYRFPIGEAPRYGAGPRPGFSADSGWAAFLAYPGSKEAKSLRKEKKRVQTTAVLVNLATGEKTELEKVRSLAFSGDNPGFAALHRYAPESQEKEKDKWTGSDLVVRELATGREVNIGNVAEYAFDKAGARLALLIDAQGQAANGLQLRDMAAGTVVALDSDKASYKSLSWSEKGEALAVLKGKEDKAYEDKLWTVLAFDGFRGPRQARKIVYDPAADKTFPGGMTVSPDRTPAWTEGLDAILFGIHEARKKKDADKKEDGQAKPGDAGPAPKEEEIADEDIPDLVLWHGRDRRLQSEQQVQESRDKSFSYLAEYRVAEKKFLRLADDEVRDVEPAPKGRYAIGQDIRAYELDSNLDGRNFADIYVIDLKTGKRSPALTRCRYLFMPLFDGTHFLYYEDGHFFAYDMAAGRSVNITRDVPASFFNEDDDHNVVRPPDYPVGSARDGLNVLLSDGWDIWSVPVSGSGKAVNLTGNGFRDKIRYRRLRLDPEEKAIDLGQPQYFSAYGEWTKKAGIARLEKGRAPAMLLWDDAGFGGLAKAKRADVFVYTRDTATDYPDYFAADALLRNGKRLTEANPQQKDFLWSSGVMLLDYKTAPKSGLDKPLQAALFLPAGYEKGKRYPTIVYYYEKMSQQLNRYAQPSANGFNMSVYTSNGYAVLMPDITYKVNDPGMSAAWCVLPAIDAAVAAGVVDRSKVGLQGHSWGGYQTAFLVTQADFAAAVAGAPLTNMISMYSSIYFNSGSANQPIFESSQGRFKGGYWDNLEAYQRNSPVYYAANVKTPLIILHNDKDGAVDWNQGIEYYNTLRRLKKPVLMLQYVGENHGLQKPANQKDYTVRMKEFFDHCLMGKPAPAWYTDGVPYLDLKEHLKERAKDLRPRPAEKAEKAEKKDPGK